MKSSKSLARLYTALKSLVCFACLLIAAPGAFAAPTLYNFTSAPGPYGYTPGLGGIFSSTDVVSGSFIYDPDSPVTGASSSGATIYGYAAPPVVASYSSLSGTAGSYAFADPRGFVTVGNDVPFNTGSPPLDAIQLYADTTFTTGPHNFIGFTAGGYTAVNLRIFWIESTDIPDFLSDQSLPPTPPKFMGRLAVDFVPSANPALPASGFVFFNGVTVTPAEPGTCN